jgi:hypothetical protein
MIKNDLHCSVQALLDQGGDGGGLKASYLSIENING